MGLFHESVTSEQWNSSFDVLRLLELSNQAVISACILPQNYETSINSIVGFGRHIRNGR